MAERSYTRASFAPTYSPFWSSKSSICARLNPASRWIFRTHDLALFSTLGVPNASCSRPWRARHRFANVGPALMGLAADRLHSFPSPVTGINQIRQRPRNAGLQQRGASGRG